MEIAVIADVHGNDLALAAVLSAIDRAGITEILALGDHLSGPLNAALTADMLMARAIVAISGNHDRALLKTPRPRMGASDGHARDEISPAHLGWLAAMPESRVHRGEIFLCHGTPARDDAYWMEEPQPDGTMRLAPRARIEAHGAGIACPVLLCGHSHLPRSVLLANGRLLVNPGSVGCPAYADDTPFPHRVETGSPRARYATLARDVSGWRATFHEIAYDHAAMASLARARGRQDWAGALATGWMNEPSASLSD
ncbi:metallophosphoesterase family protein [Ensifer soli]|uniref:metallophosphoesterase family protein n=1 Tax=Ciceribacter sp. sgz301302 TaxID=3342379 RepID=UPI0035B6D7F1